MKTEDIEAPRR